MSNKTYDTLKKIALLIAPATVFFAAIADIWALPYGSQITATLAALDVFFGAAVTILSAQYHKKNDTTDSSEEG